MPVRVTVSLRVVQFSAIIQVGTGIISRTLCRTSARLMPRWALSLRLALAAATQQLTQPRRLALRHCHCHLHGHCATGSGTGRPSPSHWHWPGIVTVTVTVKVPLAVSVVPLTVSLVSVPPSTHSGCSHGGKLKSIKLMPLAVYRPTPSPTRSRLATST